MKKSEKEKIVKDNANKTSVELAVTVASEKVYEFKYAKPETAEDYENIIFGLGYENATPEATAAYLISRSIHPETRIKESTIWTYLHDWHDSGINKVIFELEDLGFLKKVSTAKYKIKQTPKNIQTLNDFKVSMEILNTKASPIAVGVYMACALYKYDDNLINDEHLWTNTYWSRQYIERGMEELEKLGYLIDTGSYFVLDGRVVEEYEFTESIERELL